jgi:hypothetical protein
VGWETRERGANSYYYRSFRKGDRVRKEYHGNGVLGRLAAQRDEQIRLRSEKEAARQRVEKERLQQSVRFLRELEEVAQILTRAQLLVSGCHKHRGEWRRLRESA